MTDTCLFWTAEACSSSATQPTSGGYWVLAPTCWSLLECLPPGTKVGKVHWESEFRIANRVAGRFSRGPVHLAGDAAHIHAGIGARGMNLGLEDAWVFAKLLHEREMQRYDNLRRAVVEKVARQVSHIMSVPRARTAPGKLVRAMPWLIQVIVPLLRSRMQPWLLGLDHDIER